MPDEQNGDEEDTDWEDTLITTTADKLLEYLAEKKEASAKDVATALQLSEDAVEDWAEALDEAGLIDTKYTSHGLVLLQPEEQEEVIEERVADVTGRVKDQIDLQEEHLAQEEATVEHAKQQLEKLGAILQKDREEGNTLQQRLNNLAEEEEALTDALQEQREQHEQLAEDVSDALHTVDTALEEIKAAEEDIATFQTLREDIEEELDVIQTLIRRKEDMEQAEDKLDDVKEKENKIDAALNRLHTHLSNIFPDADTSTDNEDTEETYPCSTCDKTFDTQRGRSVHITKVHGD